MLGRNSEEKISPFPLSVLLFVFKLKKRKGNALKQPVIRLKKVHVNGDIIIGLLSQN